MLAATENRPPTASPPVQAAGMQHSYNDRQQQQQQQQHLTMRLLISPASAAEGRRDDHSESQFYAPLHWALSPLSMRLETHVCVCIFYDQCN